MPQRPLVFTLPLVAALIALPTRSAPEDDLPSYRAELAQFRSAHGGAHDLPDVPFFLFGMGARTKLLYKSGDIIDVRTGKPLYHWDVTTEKILPPAYAVRLTTRDGHNVEIREDEQALWITDDGRKQPVDGTRHPLHLPDFQEYPYPRVMRVLHQELLFNVTPAGPVPNLFVYAKPWYRDGAMMAMAFKATGNVDELKPWITNLAEPFDRNNAGETEADNLGQALYLISLVSDRNHPLVPKVQAEFKRFEVKGQDGTYLRGRSDFAEHPAYQTKWAKFGLAALGLDDPYVVPRVRDGYSALFWMDYKDAYVPGKDAADKGDYPYLGWAADHFHGGKGGPISNRDYPLTWERNASQAKYDGTRVISDEYANRRLAAPHTWHAAEVFLYLLEEKK